MTCANDINVPRESYRRRVGSWFQRYAKAFSTACVVPPYKIKRPTVPNDRMVELNPYLLRDIGFTDSYIPRK